MTAGRTFLAAAVLAMAAAVSANEPETNDTTDWPSAIARLRQDLEHQPGLARIRQQLAIAYNNYGVLLGEQGQWNQAVSQLEESLRYDSTNTQARQNLGRLHLNRAYEAHKQHQTEEALQAVEQALLIDQNLAPAYALRGEIEYGRQKLKDAKASWEQSLKLDPSQSDVRKRIEQVTQELPVESDFERVSQASFDIRYQEGLEHAIGFDVRDALLQARREVGSDFAYWPKQRMVVLVYSAESFHTLRQEMPEWVGGQFDGKIRVPLPNQQLNPQTVRQILYHEYTHAIIHDLTDDQCPTWLNEGLAEYEGRRQSAGPIVQLARANQQGRLIPWTELSDGFAMTLSADAVALSYQESYSIVAHLVERYGMWRLRRILKAIGEGQRWEELFPKEFRLKVTTLEANWTSWLQDFLAKTS